MSIVVVQKENATVGNFQASLSEQRDEFLNDAADDVRSRAIAELLRRVVQLEHSVCDIGCHTGKALANTDASEKVGVDASPRVLKKAAARGIRTFCFDLDSGGSLPLEDQRFDVVCCFVTLEHCIRTDHMLNEINRILKPGGALLLSVPNVAQLAAPLFWLLDLPPPCSSRYRSNHYRDFSLRLMRACLRIHGFGITSVTGTQIAPFSGAVSRCVARWLPRLAATLIMHLRKEGSVTVPDGYEATTKEIFRFTDSFHNRTRS